MDFGTDSQGPLKELTDAAEDHHNPDHQVHNPATGTQRPVSKAPFERLERIAHSVERSAGHTKHLRNPWWRSWLRRAVLLRGLDLRK